MGAIKRIFTKAPWEATVGYCRALRVGPHVFVTGTAPVDDQGNVIKTKDPYQQAKRCFEIIEQSLAELDATLEHVVRTRMFVTDISKWSDYGRAHAELFGEYPPTTTMVEVNRLVHDDMLIEIEADAYVA